jgi:hypothetical protein
MTGAGQGGLSNTGPNRTNIPIASAGSSILGRGSSTAKSSGLQTGTRQPSTAGPRFSGWGNGRIGVASGRAGYGTGAFGFSGWGSGFGWSGYGYGRNGYGYGGWDNGYGSGYGWSGYGLGNGPYVWIFMPGLGWVYVPIGLLMMLGR